MVALTAESVLQRFNYLSTDFDSNTQDATQSKKNVELIIDDCIDFLNLKAGTGISNMSGTAGSKTVTVTGEENTALKLLLGVMLRDAKYKANLVSGLGQASISEAVATQDAMFRELFNEAIAKLSETEIEVDVG